MRRLTNATLADLDGAFSALYEACGRPSIPPERLLGATLLQLLYSIRSERQLVRGSSSTCCFAGSSGCRSMRRFSTHRPFPRTANACSHTRSRKGFCVRFSACRRRKGLLSAEHFSVDGNASAEGLGVDEELSARRTASGEPPSPGRNGEADFRKTKGRTKRTPRRRIRMRGSSGKGDGQESRLSYLGHALMENRNGLVVAAEATLATGTAEREAAERLSERLPEGATLGCADKNYDAEAFVEGLEGARDRAARGDQRDGQQDWQGAQDSRPGRRRGELPAMGSANGCGKAHRRRLRLEQRQWAASRK